MKPFRIKALVPKSIRRSARRLFESPLRIPYLLAARNISHNDNTRRILDLKNRHEGQRAFVLGSGPSLNRQDLALLKDEITFVSNAFYLGLEDAGFWPTYYTVEDPLPAEDNAEELNRLTGTTKIFAHYLRYCLDLTPDTCFVFFDRYYAGYPSARFPHFSEDALRGLFWGGTVAYMSIQLAFYMGIETVYLMGIDLDYDIPENLTSDVIVSTDSDTSHFHPDYFGAGKRWHDPKVERMRRSFEYAHYYFTSRGRALYNATAGGKLDSIPRASFEQLFTG